MPSRLRSTTSVVRTSWVSLLALLMLQGALPAPAATPRPVAGAAAGNTRSGQDILNAVIAAYGGPDKIKAHHDQPMRSHGVISSNSGISTAANSYECEMLEKGDKVRVEMTMLGVPMIMGYDGKMGWTQYGDWVAPSTASQTELMSDEMKHGLPALYDALDSRTKVQLLPRQTAQGKLCDTIKITTPGGKTSTFFVDPTSHLVLRSDYEGMDHELGVKTTQSIEYYDYRPIAGSLEAYRIVQFSGNKKKSETTIKNIDADVAIDDKAFQMPPESEIARLKEGPVVIPFEYSGNEILIKARINSGPEARFIVDTGASQSVIDKAFASSLGPNPATPFSITAGSKAVPLSYTKVPSLTIGDITLNDLPVLITDLSNIGDHPAGLIGANILKRFLVTIDYDEKKLVLADPRNVAVDPSATTVSTYPVFGGTALVVKGQLDDKQTMNFLVDTGASFNNLPQSLAKPLYTGAVLPVGLIYGLDGQQMHIGSIKLKTLKLGNASIDGPVFTLAPDASTTGLFNASAMGILGNPIWSQFKTTVDYRNERLILEPPTGRERLTQLTNQLQAVDREYLKTKNPDDALKAYEKVMVNAQIDSIKTAEALAISRMAGCYADKFNKTKDGKWLDQAAHEYEHANKVALETHNRTVEGEVLAQWALMYLNAPRTMNDITAAQGLLTKALQKAPMDAEIFAAFGTTLLRVGKKAEAEKLLDRALVLDPANWQALWSKYKLYGDNGHQKEQGLVLAQLQRYYPGFPDVVAIAGNTSTTKPAPVVADTKAATPAAPAHKPTASPTHKKHH